MSPAKPRFSAEKMKPFTLRNQSSPQTILNSPTVAASTSHRALKAAECDTELTGFGTPLFSELEAGSQHILVTIVPTLSPRKRRPNDVQLDSSSGSANLDAHFRTGHYFQGQ